MKSLERKGITFQDELGGLQFCTTTVEGALSPCTLRTLLKADVIENSQLDAVEKELEALKQLMLIETVQACPVIEKFSTTYSDESSLFILYEVSKGRDLWFHSCSSHSLNSSPSPSREYVTLSI